MKNSSLLAGLVLVAACAQQASMAGNNRARKNAEAELNVGGSNGTAATATSLAADPASLTLDVGSSGTFVLIATDSAGQTSDVTAAAEVTVNDESGLSVQHDTDDGKDVIQVKALKVVDDLKVHATYGGASVDVPITVTEGSPSDVDQATATDTESVDTATATDVTTDTGTGTATVVTTTGAGTLRIELRNESGGLATAVVACSQLVVKVFLDTPQGGSTDVTNAATLNSSQSTVLNVVRSSSNDLVDAVGVRGGTATINAEYRPTGTNTPLTASARVDVQDREDYMLGPFSVLENPKASPGALGRATSTADWYSPRAYPLTEVQANLHGDFELLSSVVSEERVYDETRCLFKQTFTLRYSYPYAENPTNYPHNCLQMIHVNPSDQSQSIYGIDLRINDLPPDMDAPPPEDDPRWVVKPMNRCFQ